MAHSLLILAWAGVVGAAIGSFLTMVTYRMPREEIIGRTRSRCPTCKATLGVADLLPVVSWLSTRGKCRHCKKPISLRYPLTEIATALGTVLTVWHYGLSWEALAVAGLWWSIVAIFITDLEHQIILDEVQVAVAAFGLLYGVTTHIPLVDMAGGALVGTLIGLGLKYGYLYFRGRDGLGLGDVKFLAAAGIWLADGISFVPFLFFSGVLGVFTGIGWRLAGQGERFPFGPALAISLLFCVVLPDAANQFWKLYTLLR